MSFIAKNPLIAPEVESSPPAPITGARGVYASRDGWYDIDSNGVVKKISTDALSYKGSVKNTSSLPSNPSTGDVYNIEEESNILTNGKAKTIRIIQVHGAVHEMKDFQGTYDPSYDDWWKGRETIELFDSKGNSLGTVNVYTLQDGYLGTYPTDFLELGMDVAYAQVPGAQDDNTAPGDEVLTYEKVEITIAPNQKVFYNGSSWDVFLKAGSGGSGEYVDLSDYAKKATTLAGYGITDAYTKDEINTKVSSVYKYKGTVSHFSNLPASPEIGDVYNIEKGYHVSKDMKPITIVDSWSDEIYSYAVITPYTNLPPFYFSGSGSTTIANVYDKNLNKITEIGFYDMDKIKGNNDVVLEVGKKYYLEYFGVEQIDLDYETDIITVKFDINEGENVAWTGSEWDKLAATVDLSDYATKEEVNNKLSSVLRFKGTVETYEDLPTEDVEIGDVYNIQNAFQETYRVRPFNITRIVEAGAVIGTSLYYSDDDTEISSMYYVAAPLYDSSFNRIGRVDYLDTSSNKLELQNDGRDYSALVPGQYYVKFDEEIYNTHTYIISKTNPGDNVAWTGTEWDVLAGTIDTSLFATKSDSLSGYGIKDAYTKDETDMQIFNLEHRVDEKLTTVYKYKGSVDNYNELPTNANIGDVYNVANEYQEIKKVRPMTVESVSGLEGMGCTDFTIAEDDAAAVEGAGSAKIYTPNMGYLGTVSGVTRWTTLEIYYPDLPVGEYYFEFTNEQYNTLEIVSASIKAGDNVAWTGAGWDTLGGTVDLSNCMSKDDIIPSTQVNHGEDSLSDIIDTYVLNQDTPMATIGLDTTVPEGSLPSICNFELKPTTPLCIYALDDENFISADPPFYKQFLGDEIPLLTTTGDLVITNSENKVKIRRHIDSMINVVNKSYGWNISDTLTQDGLHKVWSKKFYLTLTDEMATTATTSGANALYTFEFDESYFEEAGIPAKLTNIPIASPCFYPGTGTVYGNDPFKLKFSYDSTSQKYIMNIRILGRVNNLTYYLQTYSKAYIYYQLETPYIEKDFLAIGLEEGDKITFENDYSYIQKYLDGYKFFKNGADSNNLVTNPDTTPTFTALVPQNTKDALIGFSNAAKIFNEGQTSTGSAAQDYSWIGDGDGTTDYTLKIQNKIKELSSISGGGTIFLGNGTYNVSGFIELYDNIKLIGTGDTIIKQTNKNSHVLVVSGSNIAIKDLSIHLYKMSATEKSDISNYNTEMTACVYINSDNTPGTANYCSDYKQNIYCQDFTMDNVYLSGSYGFDYSSGTAAMSNDYEHYRGCGLLQRSLYFNYATLTNVHISNMYCGLHGVGGSNNITVFCEATKIMVYANGGYDNINIYGHSYYTTDSSGKTISMSDVIAHCYDLEQSYIAEYVYDTQWVKNVFVFDGYTMNNRYLVSQIAGASYFSNDNEGTTIKLEDMVVDYGRGNRPVENFQNTPYHIGSMYLEKTGMSSYKVNDPITQNILSGAGVWGNITSNDSFDQGVLTLLEVCRYPQETDINKKRNDLGNMSIVSNNSPSEENPIEIIIDVSDRPIYSFPGCFIQFDHNYVASDFTVSFDIDNTNNFSHEFKAVGNTDVVWSWMFHQRFFIKIYKIKIVITKALYLESLKYQDSGYFKYEIEYNPDKKVGICNIGAIDSDFTGRAFLGECGGKVYGDLLLNQNSTIKNVPAPVDNGDAVPKEYIDGIVGDIKTALDYIKELQNSYIGGDSV